MWGYWQLKHYAWQAGTNKKNCEKVKDPQRSLERKMLRITLRDRRIITRTGTNEERNCKQLVQENP